MRASWFSNLWGVVGGGALIASYSLLKRFYPQIRGAFTSSGSGKMVQKSYAGVSFPATHLFFFHFVRHCPNVAALAPLLDTPLAKPQQLSPCGPSHTARRFILPLTSDWFLVVSWPTDAANDVFQLRKEKRRPQPATIARGVVATG